MRGDALLIAVKPDGAVLGGDAARGGCPFPGKSHASAIFVSTRCTREGSR